MIRRTLGGVILLTSACVLVALWVGSKHTRGESIRTRREGAHAHSGTFEDRSTQAGITDQLGGLVCYQADYDNDGWLDIFIPRGAWYDWPIRPTCCATMAPAVFTDVTREAGLLRPGQFQRGGVGRLR